MIDGSNWTALRQDLTEIRARGVVLAHRRVAAYCWRSWWWSVAERLARAAEKPEFGYSSDTPPLVIAGFWRSGTTLLHELLSSDSSFRSPTTEECIRPFTAVFPSARRPVISHGIRRPMDRMIVSSETPQEDEFALAALGARSIYRRLLFPSGLSESLDDLDWPNWTSEQRLRWESCFRLFLDRIKAGDSRRLLLKSPPHAFRLDLLKSILGNVQVVLIIRRSEKLYASNLRLWSQLFSLYSLEKRPAEISQIRSFIARSYQLLLRRVESSLSLLPSRNWCAVHFEELVHAPLDVTGRIYRQLDLPGFDRAKPEMEKYLTARKDYQQTVHDSWTCPEDLETLQEITATYRRLCIACGLQNAPDTNDQVS